MWYRTAGQEIYFSCRIPELDPYEISGRSDLSINYPRIADSPSYRAKGFIAGANRLAEVWYMPQGSLLRVEGGVECYITRTSNPAVIFVKKELTELDRQVLVGPALILALALCDIWCLHASAVLRNDTVTVFVGDSGAGKSTLANVLHLRWPLVADDILPIAIEQKQPVARPDFPQLKLPQHSAITFREKLPLSTVCILEPARGQARPLLEPLTGSQGLLELLSHTAGSRLFDREMQRSHLEFSARVTEHSDVYRLIYPHVPESPIAVKELLDELPLYSVS